MCEIHFLEGERENTLGVEMGRNKKRTANNRVIMNTVTTVSDWSLTLLRKCWKLF